MIIVLDTETTGLPKNYDAPITDAENWPRLVQLAWRTYSNDGTELDFTDYIITPVGFDIPDEATKLHGITTQKAFDDGVSLEAALGSLAYDLSHADYVVSHNISFDKKIIGAEYLRAGLLNALDGKQMICTMKSSVKFCAIPGPRGNKFPKLRELYQVLFAENLEGEHDAVVDCEAAARCFWELVNKGVIVLQTESNPVDEMFPPVANIAEKIEKEIAINDDLRKALHLEDVKIVEMSDEETANAIAGMDVTECSSCGGSYPVDELHLMNDKLICDDCLPMYIVEDFAEWKKIAQHEAPLPEIINAKQLQRNIIDAYNMLAIAREKMYRAGQKTIDADAALLARKNALVAEGQITGTNDTQRNAQFAAMTAAEADDVRKAKQDERDARFFFEQQTESVELVRALLRVAEMASGGRTGER